MEIRPITYREACRFVDDNHRHHKAPQGCKFCIGLFSGGVLHGVAICGRPVGRFLDNGTTCEITRLCTDGIRNGCSKLYGACVRIAKEMGYERVITYILASENGSSLKASNFRYVGEAGGIHWTGCRDRGQDIPKEMKQLWEVRLSDGGKEEKA